MQAPNGETIYGPPQMAHHLLTNDTGIETLKQQILAIDFDQVNKNKVDQETFKFEMLINISMEIIFQYLQIASLVELIDENGALKEGDNVDQCDLIQNLSGYDISSIEQILRPRLIKISILASVYETIENDKEYYCRIIFKDTCTPAQKNKYFNNNNTKFHFLTNPQWDESKINKLDDVYSVFKLNGVTCKLKFSTIEAMPCHINVMDVDI
jgi:hypothetical protein